MFSSLFGSIGGFVGSFFGGGMLSTAGRYIGKWFGDSFDDSEETQEFYKIGRTTDKLFPISDALGKTIPIVFGKARVEGRLIWSSIINEVPVESSTTKYFKTNTAIYYRTDFFYYCSFAIGICEGEIASVDRVWVNDELLDLSLHTHRIYLGSEDQLPDPKIQSSITDGLCSAHRGMAYIVFEDFPLIEYGNRLPRFSFEVNRKVKYLNQNHPLLESKIHGVNIIPGSGEFVYDTVIQTKKQLSDGVEISLENINSHNRKKMPNAIYSLYYLKEICPEVKWAAPVVCWFGNNLNVEHCEIYPAVESKCESDVFSENWQVAGRTRITAKEISKDSIGNPNYGGTVSDASVIRYLQELRAKNLKIMLYPMIFLDLPKKPWRGHMSGTHHNIHEFFTKPKGYNNFILHYARLVKGHVDAFIIGSELKSVTCIKNGANFPAVSELCNLARQVKEILGASVKVSYAADWSEYHHTEGGWYHLDELWASPNIDFIGIDNYMPLTECEDVSPTDDEIKRGFASGEGYDYYIDGGRKHPLAPEYAWKNLRWWWSNHHVNPNGARTAWVPGSKKIWFTEYGFPSIDKATNQPNVFYDPNCSDGGAPKHSNENTDFAIQRSAISHFIDYWNTQEYVENMFLWCFDARPYPEWPHANIWRDSYLWEKGHWINGKIGNQSLAAVIANISSKCGLQLTDIDVSMLDEEVFGFFIGNNPTSIEVINLLRSAYFFDIRDKVSGGIQFVKRQVLHPSPIDSRDIIANDVKDYIEIFEPSNDFKTYNIVIKFNNIACEYKEFTEHVFTETKNLKQVKFFSMPFSLSSQDARRIGEILIANSTAKNTQIKFKLPITYFALRPCDILKIKINDKNFRVRIAEVQITKWEVLVIGIVEDIQDINIKSCRVLNSFAEDKNGKIMQIILQESEETNDKKYVYFVNSFASKKPLYISSNKVEFEKIKDVAGGSCFAVVTKVNIVDASGAGAAESFVEILAQKNKPVELDGTQEFECLIIAGGKIFIASKIIKIREKQYKLSGLVFKGEIPAIGDEVIFLDKMLKLELSEEPGKIYYKTYQGVEEVL